MKHDIKLAECFVRLRGSAQRPFVLLEETSQAVSAAVVIGFRGNLCCTWVVVGFSECRNCPHSGNHDRELRAVRHVFHTAGLRFWRS